MKAALIHANGQMDNMKQIGVSATIQTRKKSHVTAEKKGYKATFRFS
jgi:hypothetical protein